VGAPEPCAAGAIGALARKHGGERAETAKLFLLLCDVPTRPLDAAQIDERTSTFGLDI
jgi:hypothetical protein